MPIDPMSLISPQPASNPVETLMRMVQMGSQMSAAEQERRIRELQIKKATQEQADDDNINKAYASAYVPNDKGVITLNRDLLTQTLASQNLGAHVPKILKSLDDADESTAKAQKAYAEADAAKRDAAGALASGVKTAGYSVPAFNAAVTHMLSNKLITAAEAKPYLDAVEQDPSKVQGIVDQFMAASPKQQEIANSAATANRPIAVAQGSQLVRPNGDVMATGAKAGPPDPAKMQAQIDAIVPPTDKANAGLRARTIARVQNARTADEAEKALDEASRQMGSVEVAKATVPYKIAVSVGGSDAKDAHAAAGVTPEAITQAAEKYAATGEMSGLGMGNAVLRRQIMNRAAELHPDGALSVNSAEFKANQKSLANVTGTLDTLSAFEKTAGKNLDQFMGTYQKLSDAGSPLLNVPLRALQGKLGNPDVAAAHAAGQVALREIARVTNDPKLSGALTDSARQEVTGLVPAGATLKQVMAVAAVLKQDMANVHSSLDDQKADITRRLSGGAAPAPAAAPAVEVWGRDPKTGKMVKKGGG